MVKRNFWDWLAWIALGFILVWLILKTLGIINTPLWLTYAPLYAATYVAGWQVNKLNNLSLEFKGFRKETVKQINEIKLGCARKHG
jgi:hypothetical protein